jgi:hypothetical protein
MVDDPLDMAADFRSELSKERLQKAGIAQRLKEQERTHSHEINQMKSLLEAEQEKSLKLKQMLNERHTAYKVTTEKQLQEASDTVQQLKTQLDQLGRYAASEDLERKLKETESKNYSLAERVKELDSELLGVREDAVRPT